MSQVWESFPGSGSELLGMLALADWSDDNGRCFPAVSSIAKRMRLSRSQAQRVVHQLIDDGFLVVTANALGGSPTQTRHYRIVLSRLTGRTDATPTGSAHATGSTGATGRTHAQEGSHPCAIRGSAHATLTVIEPSLTVNDSDLPSQVASKAADHQCPHQEIIDLYHSILPTGRRVKIWSEARKTKLRARWREDSKRQNLDWWKRLFTYIAGSEFLTGKTSTKDRMPFEIDLEWIITPANMVKIIEGKYHGEASA